MGRVFREFLHDLASTARYVFSAFFNLGCLWAYIGWGLGPPRDFAAYANARKYLGMLLTARQEG